MLNAEDDWRKQIVSASGEQYLVAGTFNTDCKFDKQAPQRFCPRSHRSHLDADSDVGLRSGSWPLGAPMAAIESKRDVVALKLARVEAAALAQGCRCRDQGH